MTIHKLRIFSLCLFFTSFMAVIGSLFISNFLFSYKITFPVYPYKDTVDIKKIECTFSNNFCKDLPFLKKKSKVLDNCNKEFFRKYIYYLKKKYDHAIFNKNFFKDNSFIGDKNEKILLSFEKRDGKNILGENLNSSCILNYDFYKYYPYFKRVFESLASLKDNNKYSVGHSKVINPYIDGETSISNISKRFPISYFFKILLFSSSVFMIFYWISYNNIFNKIIHKKKVNIFFIVGLLSSFFLFLHVLFLGVNLDFVYFQKARRIVLVLFIFFEIAAQTNLLINLYKNKEKLNLYINNFFLELKKYFVILIIIATIFCLIIFILTDPGYKFNNIIEWNFFTFLLLFYLISFLMWKKINL